MALDLMLLQIEFHLMYSFKTDRMGSYIVERVRNENTKIISCTNVIRKE